MSSGKPKSALNEVIQNWLSSCLDTRDSPTTKSPEDLHSDAATFFRYISKNTQVVTESQLVLQTRSSHEEALAQLVQDLGPAFAHDHHGSRLRALHILAGAISGCHETYLTNKVVKLLGQFLLVHCGPVDDDDYTEDYDTMIRDIAVRALTSLVSIGGYGKYNPESDEELVEAIINRMNFAKMGITYRCALPDADETPDAYGLSSQTKDDIPSGLATLPRSKRASCFDLLQQSVTGIAPIFAKVREPFKDELLYSNLQIQMVGFAQFTARCLHGESDPRCLLQLLKLVHNMQVALSPWFPLSFVSAEAVFPTEDIFDAVAPYFPVQFTPPPNDIHGITRESLHQALLRVLTFTGIDAGVLKLGHRPMLTLSADIFLEILVPPPGDDNPGPLDKLEALECLSALLIPRADSTVMELMETRIAVSLSQALKDTHDEASLGVSQGGQMGMENKRLADYCRTFICRVAFQLERCSRNELWDVVVQKTLQTMSPSINRSPSSNKTSIAYVACLTSSGGPRTLRACLTAGLQPLLDVLEHRMADDEDTAAALHGVGAFCSSCQVAMDRAKDQGVILYPHPLDSYSEAIAAVFLKASGQVELSDSIHTAAVLGIQSLLAAGGIDQLSSNTIQSLCTFLDKVSREILSSPSGRSDLMKVYASVLGNIIGGVLNQENEAQSDSLLRNPTLNGHVTNSVYPALLPSSARELNFSGLQVLAIASVLGPAVADPIMASCLEMLQTSLQEKGIDADHPPAKAVRYLLRHGGITSIRAFHKSSCLDRIFQSLNSFPEAKISSSAQAFREDLHAVQNVSNQIRIGFRCGVPMTRLRQLLAMVSDILPPLSQNDNFRVCVWLPFLAEALHATPDETKLEDKMAPDVETSSLIKELSDVLTSSEFDAATRSAAGACVYALVSLSTASLACPVEPILASSVIPTLSTTLDPRMTENSLKLLALYGSAAANRGASSSSTADKVAKFLVSVACVGIAQCPFREGDEMEFNAAAFENEQSIMLSAASAYGSMLTDSRVKPLMKQRLMHASLKYIKAAYEAEHIEARNSEAITGPSAGLLVVVSHIICISEFAKLDKTHLHQISTLVVEGLSSTIFLSESKTSRSCKNLVLTAALKVISIAPTVVLGLALPIVTGLLRAYAMSDSTSEVSCKLLALQGLEGVAHMEGTSKASASSIKPAVVAVLAAAMNHPNGLLRQAAVDVRNAWYVLD